jgi:hypothetical protein
MTFKRRGRTPALAALALLGLSAAAGAAGPEDCPAIDVPAPVRAAARVRAFVDPATGKLREPTPDELRALAEARLKARAAQPPPVFEVVTYPDGMKVVDLGDAFLFDVRVETLPDGSRKTTCVPHATPPAAAGAQTK